MRKSAYIKPSVEIVFLPPSHVMSNWSVNTQKTLSIQPTYKTSVEEDAELSKKHTFDIWADDEEEDDD